MADGRRRDEWHRASHLLTLIANVNRDPKKRSAFKPEDFFPFPVEKGPVPQATSEDKAALAKMFGGVKKVKRSPKE